MHSKEIDSIIAWLPTHEVAIKPLNLKKDLKLGAGAAFKSSYDGKERYIFIGRDNSQKIGSFFPVDKSDLINKYFDLNIVDSCKLTYAK